MIKLLWYLIENGNPDDKSIQWRKRNCAKAAMVKLIQATPSPSPESTELFKCLRAIEAGQ